MEGKLTKQKSGFIQQSSGRLPWYRSLMQVLGLRQPHQAVHHRHLRRLGVRQDVRVAAHHYASGRAVGHAAVHGLVLQVIDAVSGLGG